MIAPKSSSALVEEQTAYETPVYGYYRDRG